MQSCPEYSVSSSSYALLLAYIISVFVCPSFHFLTLQWQPANLTVAPPVRVDECAMWADALVRSTRRKTVALPTCFPGDLVEHVRWDVLIHRRVR